ncbi:MAG: hypothetical protein K6G31_07165 [Paludibacteraceae bacterium]|nr:hypothetical protein [Paludibacteraceae bacterium]
METITIEYDANNSAIKKLIEVALSLGAKVIEPQEKLSRVQESMSQIKEGKLSSYNSTEEMFEKLGI